MTDFTPTPEAVEAVARKQHRTYDHDKDRRMNIQPPRVPFTFGEAWRAEAEEAIAAFVEAEGLRTEQAWRYSDGSHSAGPDQEAQEAGAPIDYRLIGPWRPR